MVGLDVGPNQKAEVRELDESRLSRQVHLDVVFDELSGPDYTDDEFHRTADLIFRTAVLGPGIGDHDDNTVKRGAGSVLDPVVKRPLA